MRVEPPSPAAPSPHWVSIREEQRSFLETLELWGIRLEVAAEADLAEAGAPPVTVTTSFVTPEVLRVSFDFDLPRSRGSGLELSGSFQLETGGDTQNLSGDLSMSVKGTGFNTTGSWSENQGLTVEGGAVWERALYALGVSVDDVGQVGGEFAVKLGGTRVLIDPARYVRRARWFLPRAGERVAEGVRRSLEDVRKVGGVLIRFDADLMARAIQDRPPPNLDEITDLRLVSLQRLFEYGQVHSLSDITTLIGVAIPHRSQDVILIGRHEPWAPAIEMDVMVAMLASVWRDGLSPWVSLEPPLRRDDGNLLEVDYRAPHRVRFGGISPGLEQSRLLEILLRADYQMKRLYLGETDLAGIPEVKSYASLVREDVRREHPIGAIAKAIRRGETIDAHFRLWFTPRAPTVGEIWRTESGNGRLYLFPSGVRMLATEETPGADIGQAVPALNSAADPLVRLGAVRFMRRFDQLERRFPVFKQLRQVFELATMAELLRRQPGGATVLETLTWQPTANVEIPRDFEPIASDNVAGGVLIGGVESRVELHDEHLLEIPSLQLALAEIQDLNWPAPAVRFPGLELPTTTESSVEVAGLQMHESVSVAQEAIARGDLTQGLETLSDALASNSGSARLYGQRGFLQYHLGNTREAVRDLSRAIELEPSNLRNYFIRGLAWLERGDPKKALADLERYRASESTTIASLIRGDLDLDRERPGFAIPHFQQALISAHGNDLLAAEAHTGIGYAELQREGYPSAINAFSEALDLAPASVRARSGRVRAYAGAGHATNALRDVDLLLHPSRDPDRPVLWRPEAMVARQHTERCAILVELELWDLVEQECGEALLIDRRNPVALRAFFLLLLSKINWFWVGPILGAAFVLVLAFGLMRTARRRSRARVEAFRPRRAPVETDTPASEASPAAPAAVAVARDTPLQPTHARVVSRGLARLLDYLTIWLVVSAAGLGTLEIEQGTVATGLFLPILLWTFLEPLLVTALATTPGKWLLGISVRRAEGVKLRLGESFRRSFGVWFWGMAMGLPVLYLLAPMLAYRRVRKRGQARWDAARGFEVLQPSVSGLRIAAAILLLLLLLAGAFFTTLTNLASGPAATAP